MLTIILGIALKTVVVVFVFGVLILIHEAGHLIAAKKAGIRVMTFSLGMGKRLFGKEIGGTDYRVSIFPIGGFCQMAGDDPREVKGEADEFYSKPVGYRFWTLVSGSLANYIFAFMLFSIIFLIGQPTLSNKIGQILPGYPAEKAGIETGDEIVSINDQKIESWEDLLRVINEEASEGKPLDLDVIRAGKIMSISVTPDIVEQTDISGQTISRPMIGIAPRSEIVPASYGPFRAIYLGGERLIILTGMTYKTIWRLITGQAPVKTTVGGPIQIVKQIGDTVNQGFVPLLFIMAVISMALAIFNLLPFPVLDGGHIMFLILEKIRKKRLSVKVQEMLTNAAMVLLLVFMVYVSWNDILKITPLGK